MSPVTELKYQQDLPPFSSIHHSHSISSLSLFSLKGQDAKRRKQNKISPLVALGASSHTTNSFITTGVSTVAEGPQSPHGSGSSSSSSSSLSALLLFAFVLSLSTISFSSFYFSCASSFSSSSSSPPLCHYPTPSFPSFCSSSSCFPPCILFSSSSSRSPLPSFSSS